MSGRLVQQEKTFRWRKEQLARDLGFPIGAYDQVQLHVGSASGDLEITIRSFPPPFPGDLSDVAEVR